MPSTDCQGSSASFGGFGRSILSFRRDQIHSMEASHEASSMELDLDSFQKQVTDRFLELSSIGNDDLLSISWILKLLDAFLSCQEEFRSILFTYRSQIVKPPMDRLIADYLDRSVKTLDVCNAVRDGIDQLRQWQKLLEIVLIALNGKNNRKTLCEGQFRRAKKALVDLAIFMLDDKDSNPAIVSHRNRSFGRHNASRDNRSSSGHSRSLSWSVSRTWSAARQLQAIGNNLAYPRASDLLSTNGFASPVYTMNMVLLFVTWALVAAIPCQDRGLQVHFSVPRQFSWGAPMIALHDRIMEESKKRERKNTCGLLKEIHQLEKCTRVMNEQLEFPLTEEKEEEVKQRVEELSKVCDAMKAGLDPLERQVREVFRRIVRSRTDGNS